MIWNIMFVKIPRLCTIFTRERVYVLYLHGSVYMYYINTGACILCTILTQGGVVVLPLTSHAEDRGSNPV